MSCPAHLLALCASILLYLPSTRTFNKFSRLSTILLGIYRQRSGELFLISFPLKLRAYFTGKFKDLETLYTD
jgi:hypothetical protein